MFVHFVQSFGTIAVLIYISRKTSEFSCIHYFIYSQCNARESIITSTSAKKKLCNLCKSSVPKDHEKVHDCGGDVCTDSDSDSDNLFA